MDKKPSNFDENYVVNVENEQSIYIALKDLAKMKMMVPCPRANGAKCRSGRKPGQGLLIPQRDDSELQSLCSLFMVVSQRRYVFLPCGSMVVWVVMTSYSH